MLVTLRKFEERDIENKVEWINNPQNNRYLHYDLPLEVEKTRAWYARIKDLDNRYDAVIECDGVPCGLVGLLSIDRKNSKAEFYISMGEPSFKGKGIATQASKLLLSYAFETLNLNRVYLYTEKENYIAQKLFERIGFVKEGLIVNDICMNGRFIDRYAYGILKSDFGKTSEKAVFFDETPIVKLTDNQNHLFIKRDDLFPFSFGGNKARKAIGFFREFDNGGYDCVVTYGTSSSNHCRIVANMAAQRNVPCFIISPEEQSKPTNNSKMMSLFGAEFTCCPVSEVSSMIDSKIEELKNSGKKPYFIQGGGHGNIGTDAYVKCYEEICRYEKKNSIFFDYVFFASGTGTTQAGLVCGNLLNGDDRKIVGISIARKNPRGSDIVVQSVKDYLSSKQVLFADDDVEKKVCFVDEYAGEGYGEKDSSITETIRQMMLKYGIPMDSTYTGKAFAGMNAFLKKNAVVGKNVLFIHTGGTPLFFDDLKDLN